MTSDTPSSDRPKGVARDHKAEIVDRLYDVALDPVRLEDLMEVWEGRIGILRQGNVADVVPLDDPEIEAHLDRASIFLDRFVASREDGAYRSVLEDIPRSAAFLSDGGPVLAGFNRPAAVAFGLRDGAALADLPFEADDLDMLRDVIRKVASGRAERVVTLRIRSSITGSPVIVRVGPVEGETAKPLALVMSTELVWPEGFEATVQEAFGLTLAEVEIVRGITLGLPVKDIAEARGRSAETVRTQLRSILAKTEAHSQSELVRVVLGLMDMALMPSEEAPTQARRGNLEPLVYQYVKAPDGRRLEFIEFGNPAGRPVLYMHLDFGFIRWPASAERAARQRNLRVVVPVRAGYGRSDPHPKGVDHLDGVTADYLAILDWLGIRRVAVLALGADLRFALAVAAARPGLVGGILGCAAQLPLQTAAQYDRMDKWQRFILANARYAPKILPFLVQAGFSLARRMGKEKFFAQVNGGSAADMEAFARPEVREALLAGSEVTLSEKILAHHAFARECIGSERDWSALVHAAVVPVVLLQGDQDPQTPAQTIRELMGNYPHLDVRFVPKAGQLLFFAEWPMALDVLERFLPRR
jgi:pimeloyl-ACP methyl ester carboxylesterase/DNA-binding NarL/FixJ family response regulator